jgi:hypothetical protein
MDIDVLLREMEPNDDHTDSDCENSEEVYIPTANAVEEFVCQLKSISVQVGQLTSEFGTVAEEINEAGNHIRAAYRRMENMRRARTVSSMYYETTTH